MGIFDFGKRKEAPQQAARVPAEEVTRLRRQGLSNNQIVQALQRSGFQTHQIFEAFSQADLRVPSPIREAPTGQKSQQPSQGGLEGLGDLPMPPFPEGDASQNPEEPDLQPGQDIFPEQAVEQDYRPSQARYETDPSKKIEEISEAIIEEKWQDLMKDFNKLLEWKTSMEQRMAAMEQRFTDLKTGFDNLQKSVVDKVSDYDRSVKDVGTEMKALEQVFQKIIPTLTENVNELSRITKGMKPAEKKKA